MIDTVAERHHAKGLAFRCYQDSGADDGDADLVKQVEKFIVRLEAESVAGVNLEDGRRRLEDVRAVARTPACTAAEWLQDVARSLR